VGKYKLILICIGTNHIENSETPEILDTLKKLIDIIRDKNPLAMIAYCGILYRPKDLPSEMEEIQARKIAAKNTNYPPKQQCDPMKTRNDPKQKSYAEAPPKEKKLTNREIYARLPPLEQKRRSVNKSIRKLCKETNIHYLEASKCVEKRIRVQNEAKAANLKCYADDGLHLSDHGVFVFGNYLQKNAIRLLTLKKPLNIKKSKKNQAGQVESPLVHHVL
jgi:uncharacterized protein YjhX (UPF0386 family)